MSKCNNECKELDYGDHLVLHIDEALELRGSGYTKEQVVNGFQGMLGGGQILPKHYNQILPKVLKFYGEENE